MASAVRITDVGPRDGLQNEATPIATEAKVAFVKALVAAGLVSAFAMPQMRAIAAIGIDVREAAGQQLIEQHAEAVNVGGRANPVPVAGRLLRRHVRRGADHSPCPR